MPLLILRATLFADRFGLSWNRSAASRKACLAQPSFGALRESVQQPRRLRAARCFAIILEQRAQDENVVQVAQPIAERIERLDPRLDRDGQSFLQQRRDAANGL